MGSSRVAERRCCRTRILGADFIGKHKIFASILLQYHLIIMSPTSASSVLSCFLRLPAPLRCQTYTAVSKRSVSSSQPLRAGGHENPLVRASCSARYQ